MDVKAVFSDAAGASGTKNDVTQRGSLDRRRIFLVLPLRTSKQRSSSCTARGLPALDSFDSTVGNHGSCEQQGLCGTAGDDGGAEFLYFTNLGE